MCLASWSAKRAMVDNAPRFVVTLGVPARRICDASIVFCASSAKNGILMILSVDTINLPTTSAVERGCGGALARARQELPLVSRDPGVPDVTTRDVRRAKTRRRGASRSGRAHE